MCSRGFLTLFHRGSNKRPSSTKKKKEKEKNGLCPLDAISLLKAVEEKVFVCNAGGKIVLSSIGDELKGRSIQEAVAHYHAVPPSYETTLQRAIQLVCQSSQQVVFRTPLLDQTHEQDAAAGSAEITTIIKPFPDTSTTDGNSVTVIFSKQTGLSSLLDVWNRGPFFDSELSYTATELGELSLQDPSFHLFFTCVLRSVAKLLAETLKMRYGWVSRTAETAPWRVQMVAFWDNQQKIYLPTAEFDMEESFWGLLGQNEGPMSYPCNARNLFPTDPLLNRYEIESLAFSSPRFPVTDRAHTMWIGVMSPSPAPWKQATLQNLLGLITEKVEGELYKLKQQHLFWLSDKVLKQMSDAVIILDMGGKIVQWKGTADQLFGVKEEEMRGNTLRGLIAHENDYQEFADWLAMAMSRVGGIFDDPNSLKREIQFKKKGGENFEGEMSCNLIRTDIPILVLVVVRDITERIQRSKDLQRVCALLERSRDDALAGVRMKSLFLANVSHEIRTPMNAIVGMTQLLLDTVLTTSQRELVEDICIASDHLVTIINDILDLSKLDAGKVVLERREIPIKKCIEDAYSLASRSIPNSSVRFSYEISQDVPERIVGDPTRLRQILINLLSNALKFTKQGFIHASISRLSTKAILPIRQTIATSFQAAVLSDLPPPSKSEPGEFTLLFVINDSGIGIPTSSLQRIFEPFEQGDTSSIRKHGGTGLGLSICARLVQCMGGNIWVETQQSKGSTFSFTITTTSRNIDGPVTVQESVKSSSISISSSTTASSISTLESSTSLPITSTSYGPHNLLSVLVVEDNLMNQKVISKLLSKIGCNTDLACNGVEAVEAATKKHYDVIFMDIQMPEMDGIEATRHITKIAAPSNCSPPIVVALTASACEPDEIARYHESGIVHILTKPIKLELLRNVLDRLPWFQERLHEVDPA